MVQEGNIASKRQYRGPCAAHEIVVVIEVPEEDRSADLVHWGQGESLE
jgi:hypothetical protein